MKKICLVIFLLPTLLNAQGLIRLKEPLDLSKNGERCLGVYKKKDKSVTLLGHAQTTSLDAKTKLVQILWHHSQKGSTKVPLKTPLQSVFKTEKTILEKSLVLEVSPEGKVYERRVEGVKRTPFKKSPSPKEEVQEIAEEKVMALKPTSSREKKRSISPPQRFKALDLKDQKPMEKLDSSMPLAPAEKSPVRLRKSCDPIHLFEEKKSYAQEKVVVLKDGVEEIELPCHQVGDPLPHVFNKRGCAPLQDLETRTYVETGIREIDLKGARLQITGTCEPIGEHTLRQTNEGCEGHFHHDFEASKSYQKKRYYYLKNNEKKFVTACLRSNQSYAHHREIAGYLHDDAVKVSYPHVIDFIETGAGRVRLQNLKVDLQKIPYVFVERKDIPSRLKRASLERGKLMVPQDKIDVYKRADETFFEEIVGDGVPAVQKVTAAAPQKTVIQVIEEAKEVNQQVPRIPGSDKRGLKIMTLKRTAKHYSDGTVVYGRWEIRGERYDPTGPYVKPFVKKHIPKKW